MIKRRQLLRDSVLMQGFTLSRKSRLTINSFSFRTEKKNKMFDCVTIIVSKLFLELFGSMRLRLQYSWEGHKGKQGLDKQRKSVLKTYVIKYYPET